MIKQFKINFPVCNPRNISKALKYKRKVIFNNGFMIDCETNKWKIRIFLNGQRLQEYNYCEYNKRLVPLYIQKYEQIKAEQN